MSREYDARSRVPSKEYKDNFDKIFRKKEEPATKDDSADPVKVANEVVGDQGSGQHG